MILLNDVIKKEYHDQNSYKYQPIFFIKVLLTFS